MADDDEDLPATQPVIPFILEGIVAYVEVRFGHDNRSRGIKAKLRDLGAKVVEKLTQDVSHVIFNEGLPSTFKKAKKLRCHLVSVLWIEACEKARAIVSEAVYPPINKHTYDDPHALKKFKKMKSMQPDFEDVEADKKIAKKLKNIQRRTRIGKSIVRNNNKKIKETGEENKNKCTGKRKICLYQKSKEKVNFGKRSRRSEASDADDQAKRTSTTNDLHLPSCSRKVNEVEDACSSSSSVLLEELHDQRSKKRMRSRNESPMSRHDFMKGLNDIVQKMKSDNDTENSKSTITSPLKTSHGAVCNLKTPISYSPASFSPRRSPRHSKSHQNREEDKKSKHMFQNVSCFSASATLMKHKLSLDALNENSCTFSQEIDSASSTDSLLPCVKKGNCFVDAEGEQVTLSQVVRSYDTFAQGYFSKKQSDSKSDNPENSIENVNLAEQYGGDCVPLNTSQLSLDETTVIASVSSLDVEEASHSSESGSSTSCCSTRVLINGNFFKKFSTLTDVLKIENNSSFVSLESLPSALNVDENSENGSVSFTANKSEAMEGKERVPSPVFVINKLQFRRPVRITSKIPTPKASYSSGKADVSNSTEKPVSQKLTDGLEDHVKSSSSDYSGKIGDEDFSNDSVHYLNQTIHFLRHDFFPSLMVGTSDGAPLAEDNIDVTRHKAGLDSEVIPSSPHPNEKQIRSVCNPSPRSSSTPVMTFVSKKTPLFRSGTFTKSERTKVEITPQKGIPESSNEAAAPSTKSDTSIKNGSLVSNFCEGSRREGILTKKECCDSEALDLDQTHSSNYSESQNVSVKSSRQSNASSSFSILNNTLTFRRSGRFLKAAPITHVDDQLSQESENEVKRPRRFTLIPSGISSKVDKLRTLSPSCGSRSMDPYATTSKGEKKKDVEGNNMIVRVDDISKSNLIAYRGPSTKHTKLDCSGPEAPQTTAKVSLSGKSEETTLIKSPLKRKKTEFSLSTSKLTKRAFLSRSCSEPLSFLTHSDQTGSNSLPRKSSQEARKRLAKTLTTSQSKHGSKVIVFSFLTASEQNAMDSSLRSLQNWIVELKVSARTTHVVSSGPKRTMNMLKGMAHGCWLVHQDWVHESSKIGDWVGEEQFELVGFAPALKLYRLRRKESNGSLKNTLFSRVGPIFVFPKLSAPPAKEVSELIKLFGGQVTKVRREAQLVVGTEDKKLRSVIALWILDCITQNKLLPLSRAYEFV